MKQTIEERKQHHQTREDRQRKAYEVCLRRIRVRVYYPRTGNVAPYNVAAAERDAANLARKLQISD